MRSEGNSISTTSVWNKVFLSLLVNTTNSTTQDFNRWRLKKMQIENEVRKFIMDNFIVDGENHLSDEDSLLEKGIIDSTGVLELVAFIEETYPFKIKDEELVPENLDSIKNISQFIRSKLQENELTLQVRSSVAQGS